MTAYELVAKISLDTSAYDRGLSQSSSKLSKFGGVMSSGFGKIAKAGSVLMGAGIAAVTAFGASSVKSGMTFDKSMSQVAATMGKTMTEMENEVGEVDLAWGHFSGNLRDYAQEMGAHTAFSASQAADALNYMALAGYDTEKSMSMLPNVLNLAAAGGMELATASDMVTDASSALGLSTEETTALVDKMAQASSKSNTSVEQLGSAMLTVGGTAKVLSGGTTELATALGILADNGVKGAEGGTALRNILTSIQGDKFEKTFGSMGISAYDAEGNLRSLKDVFGDMNTAMEGMTDEEKTDLINKTFNSRDLKNVNALLGTSADRWDELSGAIDDSSGAAQKMADTQLDNLAGDITLFKSALEGAQIALSDKISPALRGFVKEGSEGLSKMTESLKDGDFAGAMTILGETIANVAVRFAEGIPQIVTAGASLIQGLVTGIVSSAPQLMGVLTDTVNSAMDAFDGIDFGKVGETLLNGLGSAMEGAMAVGDLFVTAGVDIINKLSEGLATGIPAFLEGFLPMLLTLSEYLRENASTLIDAGLNFIVQLAQGIANGLPVLIAYLPQIISNIANIINDNAPKILMTGVKIITTLGQGIVNAWPAIVANFGNILRMLFDVFMAINWVSLGTNLITFIKNGITTLQTAIPETLKNIGQKAMEWLSTIQWSTLGADIIDLIVTGVQSLGAALPEVLKTIATTAVNAFKAVPWLSIGKAALSMLVTGIRGMAGGVVNAIKRPFNLGKNIVKSYFQLQAQHADAELDKLKAKVKSKLDSVRNTIKGILDKVKGFFPLKIGNIFSGMKLPHFSVSGSPPFGIGGKGTKPSISVKWYKKALEEPYLFSNATLFGAGEAGDEMLYGRQSLLDDISSVVNGQKENSFGRAVQITNYITVEGAEDPEDFAERFIRKLKLDMRTA